MTLIKSARKTIQTKSTVKISRIAFNSLNMCNTVEWEVNNPTNENILSFDLVIFENDTSSNNGFLKKTIELSSSTFKYFHRNIEIISRRNYFKTYSYQVILYTNVSSSASKIEKFDPREIYEIDPPKQVTYSIRNDKIYFNISCDNNKFATNIFIFRKKFDDDVFERIGVIPYRESSTFVDSVSLGSFYEYRFITYDIFKHFSQKIVKIDIFVWDKNYASSRNKTLFDPIPIAEYASESSNKSYIKLKITNIDQRCSWYRVKRRDISEKTRTFNEIEQWNNSNLIKNDNTGIELIFIDSVVRDNALYQYCVTGYDKFSNETDTRQSNIVSTEILENLPASPINIFGEIVNEYPTAVKLEWVDDNLNQSLANIVSGSSDLFPKENLFYFKVFRRKYNELNYQYFPEQSSSILEDKCSNDGVVVETKYPYYQPEPPVRDNKYYYYVATYDSTSNKRSNRSAEVAVDFSVPPSEVTSLESFLNPVFEPLKCVLKWNESENTKTLDSFLVERLEENKMWKELGKSYFCTQFVDDTIVRNKKYMYRVRAKDFNGNLSKWSYIIVDTN